MGISPYIVHLAHPTQCGTANSTLEFLTIYPSGVSSPNISNYTLKSNCSTIDSLIRITLSIHSVNS